MKLRFTPRAVQDLSAIANYISSRNPPAALRLRAAILDCVQNLLIFPRAGRVQSVAGVRKIVSRKYPYLIYYTADDKEEEIIIVTVQHPAQEREYEDA